MTILSFYLALLSLISVINELAMSTNELGISPIDYGLNVNLKQLAICHNEPIIFKILTSTHGYK